MESRRGSSLMKSAGVAGSATMASRVLGLAREQVMAHLFGASDQMDAFNVAFRLPNLVRDLFAEGAMSAAFVPTFTRQLQNHGREAAWTLGRRALTSLLLVTGVIAVVGILGAPAMTRFFAGGFASVPGKLELTIQLTRVMFPFLVLVAAAVAMMGMLNALGKFFIPALSPAMFNVASIASAIALVPFMPALGYDPVMGLAIGVLLGGFGQVLMQWPLLRREGFRFRPDVAPRDPALHEILLLMGPGTVGLAATQFNVYVNTVLATSQESGAVSWLNYAFRILYLPVGIFGVSIATAALPMLSRQAAADDTAGLRSTVSHASRLMLMLNIPATFGLVVLAVPIVRLIFERGEFGPTDTVAVAAALVAYSPGLLGYSIVKVLSPTFYAMRDARTPVTISIVSVLVNAALNIALVRAMGYVGLGLGTAVASLINAGLLLFLLRRRLGGIDGRRIAWAVVRMSLASSVMAACVWAVHFWLEGLVPGSLLPVQMLRVGLAIVTGLVVLVAMSRVLRIDEFDEAIGKLVRRLRPVKTGGTHG
jgi:putative peptidoglycan lipid II flippase